MVLEKNTGELLRDSTQAVGRSRLEVRQPVQDAAVVQVRHNDGLDHGTCWREADGLKRHIEAGLSKIGSRQERGKVGMGKDKSIQAMGLTR